MNKPFDVVNGLYFIDEQLSELEFSLFREFEDMLLNKGYKYLSLPSAGSFDVIKQQEVIKETDTLAFDNQHALFGSAEQGFLYYFQDTNVNTERKYFSLNECFRNEKQLNGLKTLYEFKKLEQYIFCKPQNAEKYFNEVLNNSLDFLKRHNIKCRVVDKTTEDKGYHIKKYDIEVYTKKYGWLETHSCTYFGAEQTKRLNIGGGMHTISNTGIASPRILIPFMERLGIEIP